MNNYNIIYLFTNIFSLGTDVEFKKGLNVLGILRYCSFYSKLNILESTFFGNSIFCCMHNEYRRFWQLALLTFKTCGIQKHTLPLVDSFLNNYNHFKRYFTILRFDISQVFVAIDKP